MKRFLFVPMLALLLFFSLALSASALVTFEENGFVYTLISDYGNYTSIITGYKGGAGPLSIPDTLGGYPVSAIGGNAFKDRTDLTGNLVFPDSIRRIDSAAFQGCTGLTGTLTLPSKLTKISPYAFASCSGLTGSLVIPNGVASIGYNAFDGCSGFNGTLTIPNSVTEIGSYAFRLCSGLTGSLTIPDSVTTIGYYAFDACLGLNGTLTLSNKLTVIDSCTFRGCGFTGELVIPDSVTDLNHMAFCYCAGFTSVKLPASIDTIHGYAFYDCGGLTGTLIFPAGLKEIKVGAFSYCRKLTGTLSFPSSIERIGEKAFYECTSLTGDLVLPEGVTEIGASAFYGCTAMSGRVLIPSTLTVLPSKPFPKNSEGKGEWFFYGNVPTTWEDDETPFATIYYLQNKTGWATPTWTSPSDTVYNATPFDPATMKPIEPIEPEKPTCSLSELDDVDYLAFSSLVYMDLQIGQTVCEYLNERGLWGKLWDDTDIRYNELFADLANWHIDSILQFESSGFYAASFMNNDGETVISYRGSTPWGDHPVDVVLNDPDWLDNDVYMIFGGEGAQVSQALRFADSVLNDSDVTNIAVTGHSLGGGLCDIVAARHDVMGTSFNSAPFLDIAYWYYDRQMGEHFTGIDNYSFIAHVNKEDTMVGNWPENVKPKRIHNGIEGKFPHSLNSLLIREYDGMLKLTGTYSSRIPTNVTLQFLKSSELIILGTSENDTIRTIPHTKTKIFGGDGHDIIQGGDVIVGGRGNDTIDSYNTDNNTYIYYKGDGIDTISDSEGDDRLILCGFSSSDVIHAYSDPEDDFITVSCNGYPIVYIRRDRSFFSKGTFLCTAEEIGGYDLIPLMKQKKYFEAIRISCPVDIEILDSDGKVVHTVKDGEESVAYTDYGDFYVCEEESGEYSKYIHLVEGYDVRIVGVGEGTMDIEHRSYDPAGGKTALRVVNDVPVSETMTATLRQNGLDSVTLRLDSDGDGVNEQNLPLSCTLEANASAALTFEEGYISGIPVGYTAAELADCFGTDKLAFTDSEGNTLAGDAVLKTRDVVKLLASDGTTVLDEAYIVVTGDVNGDCTCDVLDLLRVRQMLEEFAAGYWELLASDLNNNGAPDTDDLIAMIKAIAR